MKHFLSSIVILLAIAAPAASMARDIVINPEISGSVGALTGGETADVTALKVCGPVDAADFMFISSALPALVSLDLSEARIDDYRSSMVFGKKIHARNTIPSGAFAGSTIQEIRLPEGSPLVIGEAAFAGSALREITIPENTTSIGSAAFAACKELKKVSLMAKDTAIPAAAFAECSALEQFAGSSGITEIGRLAFRNCSSLRSFDFGKSLRRIEAQAFAGSALESADMSRCPALGSLDAWAFAECPELKTSVLSPATLAIGEGAFMGCRNLLKAQLPAEAEIIPAFAFAGDGSLDASAMLPYAVSGIGAYALKGLSATSAIELPESLAEIGDNAMEGMTALEAIYANKLADVPATGAEVWKGIAEPQGVLLHVPAHLIDAFSSADQWKEFTIVSGSDTKPGIAEPARPPDGGKPRGRHRAHTPLHPRRHASSRLGGAGQEGGNRHIGPRRPRVYSRCVPV